MRCRRHGAWVGGLILIASISSSCTSGLHQPTLTLEQHTLRIPLTVHSDGSVSLAQEPPLTGRIDLGPILAAEGMQTTPARASSIQLMMHYGRYYVVADGFHALWELTPLPGTSTARYRSIPLDPGASPMPLKGVRLSRYGGSESSCLRVDGKSFGPLFITPKGEVLGACP